MKKLLFIAGLFATMSASAQYSQWVYGNGVPNSYEELCNGKVLRVNPAATPGHIMAGFSQFSTQDLYIVKNNVNGSALAVPYFNNTYTLADASGNILQITNSKVVEMATGLGYGVSGQYYNPVTGLPGIYYLWLDPRGNPAANPVGYQTNPASPAMRFGSLREDNSGSNIYITGNVFNLNNGTLDLFIMKIRTNGAVVWANVYNIFTGTVSDEMGYDVIEPQLNPNEVAVTGTINYGGDIDAYFLRVNSATGNPITGIAEIYGMGIPFVDELYSIDLSRANIGGTWGYVLCGKSNATLFGDYDMWGLRVDNTGVVQWSTLYQYNDGLGSNPDNWGSQGIERRNTLGAFEYYFVGTTMNGVLGNEDVHVVKADVNGIGVPFGQFTYGGTGYDVGTGVDINNGMPGTGLAVFGSTMNSFAVFGSLDYYFVKAYFNGVSGCNEDLRDPINFHGPWLHVRYDYTITNKLLAHTLKYVTKTPQKEQNLCFNPTIPGGNNTLQAKVVTDLATPDMNMTDGGFTITPNPAAQGASNVQLSVTARTGQVDVIVADFMGREYVNQRFDITNDGEHMLMVELGKANLAPGLYLIRVNGLDKPASQVLVIK